MTDSQDYDHNLLLDFDGLISLIGIKYSRTTIWRMCQDGRIPKPIRLAGTRLVWKRSEVLQWLEDEFKNRRNTHYGDLR